MAVKHAVKRERWGVEENLSRARGGGTNGGGDDVCSVSRRSSDPVKFLKNVVLSSRRHLIFCLSLLPKSLWKIVNTPSSPLSPPVGPALLPPQVGVRRALYVVYE